MTQSLFTDAHRAELERLLKGAQDAEEVRSRTAKAAVEAQAEADEAARQVGRWDVAYNDYVAKLRREVSRG